MESLTTVPLLITDDFGMRKLPMTAAEDLLEIVMGRYERASTLLTSNRPVEDRGKRSTASCITGTCLSAAHAVGEQRQRPLHKE
jgi:DNA replication protein DnaC